jgi:hypothetical protein
MQPDKTAAVEDVCMTHMGEKSAPAPTDPHPARDSGEEADVGTGRRSASGPPRWVSALGILVAVGLVVLLFVLHLTGVLGPGAH